MLKDLNIPRMGSVENARMVGWRVAEGASYLPGDVLYEIETDKTTTEVEADEPGVLVRQIAVEGDEFKVGDRVGQWGPPGTSLASLGDAGGGAAGAPAVAPASPVVASPPVVSLEPAAASVPATPVGDGRPVSRSVAGGARISPLARRLAGQLGIDVGKVTGSGSGGRITSEDVRSAAANPAQAQIAAPVTAPAARAPESAPVAPPPPDGEASVIPHTMRRRTIARRMVESGNIPTRTADMEIELSALMAARKREGGGVSVLAMIAHETVAVLRDFPQFNAHWREDALVQWHGVHLGIAVDTPEGLVVPVIRNAELLNARGITAAIADLAARARDGKLGIADMEGGTFTISNPGSVGPVLHTEALLNPPEVAILSLPGFVNAVKAVADEGGGWAMVVRPVLRPSITFDHRAIDGGPAVQFLNALKARIEAL